MEKYFEQQLTVQLVADSVKKIFMNIPRQQQIRLPIFEDARYRSENSLAIRFELLSSETGSWKNGHLTSFHRHGNRAFMGNAGAHRPTSAVWTGASLQRQGHHWRLSACVSKAESWSHTLSFSGLKINYMKGNDLTPPTPIIITSQNCRVKREKENIVRRKRGPIFLFATQSIPISTNLSPRTPLERSLNFVPDEILEVIIIS